ncbi:N-acetylglucosamine-6-phosphate deacetylase [Frateuria aurantia]
MHRLALVNARVMGTHGPREGRAVVIEHDRIVGVFDEQAPELVGVARHDLDGRLLLPGYIDVQVNGGGGLLFNDSPDVETLRGIARAHRRFGTTAMLPTLITDTQPKMEAAIAAVDAAMSVGVEGIVGIHLEGPFLATQRKGIHNADLFRLPDARDFAMLAKAHRGVTMLTLAPERVGNEAIAHLAGSGVIVVAGHTAADYATIRASLDAGVCGFTHLFNAMTPMGSREPGVVGAALDDPDSWCGLIVDGHHVSPASLRVAIAAKPRGKMVLVTDAMPPVGSDQASFTLDGQVITARDGICQNDNGTLAGSALDMASAVRHTVQWLGIPLAEASRMASEYPAQWLGLGHSHGRIAAGYQADFVVLDDELQVVETWIGGRP